MVSILPAEKSPLDVILKQVGAGLSQTLPGVVERYGERQRGMNALDMAQQELANAGGNPQKMALAYARLAMASPEASRAFGPLFQTALQQAGAKGIGEGLGKDYGLGLGGNQSKSNLPVGFLNQPVTPQTGIKQPVSEVPTVEGKKTSHDIDTAANQYLAQVRPDLINPASQYGAIANFDSEIKRDLTPQEEGKIRQELVNEGKPAEIIDKIVDRLRQGIQTKYQEAQDKYGFDKERIQQDQEKWKQFTQNAPARLQPFLSKYSPNGQNLFPNTVDLLKNKYFQYAGKLPTSLTPEQMHSNAMANLQKDINKLDALAAIPEAPPFHTEGQVKDYIDTNKEAYKDLADQGFQEALKEDALNNKGLGNEEFHSILWEDQTNKKLLNELNQYKKPEEFKNIPYYHANKNYKTEKSKYENDLTKSLMKLGPNDDLILARAMVLNNGGDVKDFGQALTRAREQGLKLSPFQEAQLQEINIPRRPPLWEIFRGIDETPHLFGLVGKLNWKPFINYVLGKR